jgi:hypothetical protein
MTPTMEKPQISADFPTTRFHSDGVRTQRVENETELERFMAQGCWHDVPQEPPPPPPPPMSPEEKEAYVTDQIEGIGGQVDAQAQTLMAVEERLLSLERHSHAPFDFDPLIERVEKLEQRVDGQIGTTSSTWGRIKVVEDGLKDVAALLADVKASMDQAAPALQMILQRLDALENRKAAKGQ